jgi:type II secretory pathway pseudopilin PulG
MGRKATMFPPERNRQRGWGLFEVLLAVGVSTVIMVVVTMGARQALDTANAHDCSKNLALIESAKDEFTRDNPGVPLTSAAQLAKYLKYGIPVCPSGGAYNHILDLTQTTTCSLGGKANKANYHTLVP